MIEPAMPDWRDMSIYFPGAIQNQFGFSAGTSYGQRDQEPNYFGKQSTCKKELMHKRC